MALIGDLKPKQQTRLPLGRVVASRMGSAWTPNRTQEGSNDPGWQITIQSQAAAGIAVKLWEGGVARQASPRAVIDDRV